MLCQTYNGLTHLQVTGPFNADLHDYLDLANIYSTQYNTRGQKKRQKAELAKKYLANIEIINPNTRARKQRQKVPDDEDIDMNKIHKDDMPRYNIK